MPRLSTHILDTANGMPAAGVRVDLHQLSDGTRALVGSGETNSDGRHSFTPDGTDEIPAGLYELTFFVGAYFESRGNAAQTAPFLETVPVRFRMAAGERYHVPLLASPFGYTSYRGS